MEYRAFIIKGRSVAVSLEEQFWDCLEEIAVERNVSLMELVGQVSRKQTCDLQSALRLHVLEDVLQKTEICESTDYGTECARIIKYH